MKIGVILIITMFFALQVSAGRYEIYKLHKGTKGFAIRQESISDTGTNTI